MQRKLFKVFMAFLMFVGIGVSPLSTVYAETLPFEVHNLDLPEPLSDADVKRYQDIFALQQDKKWKEADKLIKDLDSDLLLGRVLSQRYLHPTGWRSSYKELSSWLKKYNDHPAASRISWLAKKRKPSKAKAPKAPKKGYLNGYGRSSGRQSRYSHHRGDGLHRQKHVRLPVKFAIKSDQVGHPGVVICSRKAICDT